MAKKKKKTAKKQTIDLNQTMVDNLQIEAKEEPVGLGSIDDEFDALLRSFIDSEEEETDTQTEPQSSDMVTEDNHEADLDIPEPNDADVVVKFRRELSQLNLTNDENELAQAYANFITAISEIAKSNQLELPDFFFTAGALSPNYKPSTGRKIVADAMLCWDILFKAYPDKLAALNPSASDEEFLSFAESIADQNLQLAVISYVEILIDIENCEISYEERRLKAQRRRVEKALYEEYQHRQEIRKRFIQEISRRRFPIDAEKLVTNYLKTAAKDVDGAYKILTTNPAVYASIEINKIKPRFFGLLKVTPKDGIRENQRLAEFLKKLKA